MSGGMRSVQMAKQVVTTLKMVPLSEAVNIHMVPKYTLARGRSTVPSGPVSTRVLAHYAEHRLTSSRPACSSG